MALVILWRLLSWIVEGGNETATVRNHQLQRSCSRTLIMTSGIIADPTQHTRYARIQTYSHKARDAVLGVRIVYVGDNSIAGDCREESNEQDDAT